MTIISKTNTTPPSMARLIISMAIAGFFSGLIIIGIYLTTLDTIKENQARELREAVFKVLPGVSQMQKMRFIDGQLQKVTDEEIDNEALYAGFDANHQFVGYAIQTSGPGFQDIIRLLYGYRPDRQRVVGMEILESRETPGLGDKIYKDLSFVANFHNLAVSPTIKVVKKGKKSANNEVDAITGVTISSKAVVRIINESNQRWLKRLAESGKVPVYKVHQEKTNQDKQSEVIQ